MVHARRTMLSALVLSAISGLMVLLAGSATAAESSVMFTGVREMSLPAQMRPDPEPPVMRFAGVPARPPAPRVEPDEYPATFNRGGVPVLNNQAIDRNACRFTESFLNFFPEVAAAKCKKPVLDDRNLRDVVLTRSAAGAAVTVICRSGGGWLDVRASSPEYGEIEGIVAADAVDLRGVKPVGCSS